MSAALLLPPVRIENLPRKRFTSTEVTQMLELGLFNGQRYELIAGDLIDKMGQNPPHSGCIRLLWILLSRVFSAERVAMQLPVEAGSQDCEISVPEPDLSVTVEAKPEYWTRRHPRGDELFLAIEVSDTTALHDLTTKRDLYARAAIREYWVLDINARKLIVHRGVSEGKYSEIFAFAEDETVHLHAGLPFRVSDILPKPETASMPAMR